MRRKKVLWIAVVAILLVATVAMVLLNQTDPMTRAFRDLAKEFGLRQSIPNGDIYVGKGFNETQVRRLLLSIDAVGTNCGTRVGPGGGEELASGGYRENIAYTSSSGYTEISVTCTWSEDETVQLQFSSHTYTFLERVQRWWDGLHATPTGGP